MEEETRRVGPTPTAERGSIAFRCKKAQPRTPAIVVLLIGHMNRSGKTHKLDQLVVEERERLTSQARYDNATPHFMPSRSPSRCLSFLLSWNLYFIFAWNFSSLVEHAHMTDRGDVTVYRGSGSGGCTIFRSVADQGSRKGPCSELSIAAVVHHMRSEDAFAWRQIEGEDQFQRIVHLLLQVQHRHPYE